MERPNKDDYAVKDNYVKDLEKYCDELENRIDYLEEITCNLLMGESI